MFDQFLNFFEKFQLFDLIYLALTILSLIKCSSKGFVLSVLSASKWLFSYVVALYLFPKAKLAIGPTVENGFYYDILFEKKISIEDFPVIEEEMRKIISTGIEIRKLLKTKN